MSTLFLIWFVRWRTRFRCYLYLNDCVALVYCRVGACRSDISFFPHPRMKLHFPWNVNLFHRLVTEVVLSHWRWKFRSWSWSLRSLPCSSPRGSRTGPCLESWAAVRFEVRFHSVLSSRGCEAACYAGVHIAFSWRYFCRTHFGLGHRNLGYFECLRPLRRRSSSRCRLERLFSCSLTRVL